MVKKFISDLDTVIYESKNLPESAITQLMSKESKITKLKDSVVLTVMLPILILFMPGRSFYY